VARERRGRPGGGQIGGAWTISPRGPSRLRTCADLPGSRCTRSRAGRAGSSFDTDATDLAVPSSGGRRLRRVTCADAPLLRALGLVVQSELGLPQFKLFVGALSLRGSDDLKLLGGTAVLLSKGDHRGRAQDASR
jgi:hypothetical protein